MTDIDRLPYVEAELNYLAHVTERPRYYAYEIGPDEKPYMPHESHRVKIHDMRPVAGELTLDGEGFQLVDQHSAVRDFWDDDEVRRVYYPEAEALLKQVTGASRVFVFDHTQRRRVADTEDRATGRPRQPASRVHVDHTAKSGPQRVRDLLGVEADEWLKGRIQVINLWRPLYGPLQDAPLAVCNAKSVAPDELVPSDLVYRNRTGETYSVTYSPKHEWFYVPEMQRDEVLLLKCSDTADDGRARFMPHTAFTDPTTPADARPRESIELRTLVFHPA